MRSAALKSTRSLRALRGRLMKIPIILHGILRKVYTAIPHKNVSNLCQVPYMHMHVRTYVPTLCMYECTIHCNYIQSTHIECVYAYTATKVRTYVCICIQSHKTCTSTPTHPTYLLLVSQCQFSGLLVLSPPHWTFLARELLPTRLHHSHLHRGTGRYH